MPDQPAPDFEEARRIAEERYPDWMRRIDDVRQAMHSMAGDPDDPELVGRELGRAENLLGEIAKHTAALLSEREAREEVIEAAKAVDLTAFPPPGPRSVATQHDLFKKLHDALNALPATESAQAEQQGQRP